MINKETTKMKNNSKNKPGLMAKHRPFSKTAAVAAVLLATQPAFALDAPKVSGALEVEVSSSTDYTGTKSSDIALATAALAFEGSVNKHVNYNISFLYEDGTPLELDEGYITINVPRTSSYFSAGQLFVPFGNFSTAMVSDPVTLEMGETREDVLQFGFETNTVYGSVYAFNGELDEVNTDSTVADIGANAGIKFKRGKTEMDFGVGYISNLAETDGISGAVPATIQKTIAGITAHAVMNFGNVQVVAEYLGATDTFATADLAFNGQGAEPSAYNVELAFTGDVTVGVSYQATEEAVALGLPESKVLVAVSYDLYENTNLALEFSSSDDYSVADGGTGKSADSTVVKLAVEF